jgi:hypothetical protein
MRARWIESRVEGVRAAPLAPARRLLAAQSMDERARESDATVTAHLEATRRWGRIEIRDPRTARAPLSVRAKRGVELDGVAEGPGEMEPCQWAALESFTAGLERTPP